VVDWDEHIARAADHLQRLAQWRLAIANNIAQKPLLASPEPSIHRRQPAAAVSRSNLGPRGRSITDGPSSRRGGLLMVVVRGGFLAS
jgi:hypothetical protein